MLRIIVNGVMSGCRSVTSGITQDSVLGPSLFNIFINDLDRGLEDILSLWTAVNWEELLNPSRRDLDKLDGRATVCFNMSKCWILHIGQNSSRYMYRLEDERLESSITESDLRVLVGGKLSLSQQCALAAKGPAIP